MKLLGSMDFARSESPIPGRISGNLSTGRGPRLLAAVTFLALQGCEESPVDNGNAIYAIEVNDPERVLEGTDLVFTITRSVDLSKESTVMYDFAGEATFGEDYDDPNGGSISFSAGQSTMEIRLETLRDDETEEEETLEVILLRASDGGVDPNLRMATGYIRDGIPSCSGPEARTVFINFDDIQSPLPGVPAAGSGTRLQDGYRGFIWGDWWARDDVMRSQDEGQEPGRGWQAGMTSTPNAIYPSFGAQPGSVSVIAKNEPFILKSFYMSALSTDNLPVTLRYRDATGAEVGQETFIVSRGSKTLIQPDINIMSVNCLSTVSFTQPTLGASFIIDDMTLVY